MSYKSGIMCHLFKLELVDKRSRLKSFTIFLLMGTAGFAHRQRNSVNISNCSNQNELNDIVRITYRIASVTRL